jgi:hypothetical protein
VTEPLGDHVDSNTFAKEQGRGLPGLRLILVVGAAPTRDRSLNRSRYSYDEEGVTLHDEGAPPPLLVEFDVADGPRLDLWDTFVVSTRLGMCRAVSLR